MTEGWSSMGFLYLFLFAYELRNPVRTILLFSHQGCLGTMTSRMDLRILTSAGLLLDAGEGRCKRSQSSHESVAPAKQHTKVRLIAHYGPGEPVRCLRPSFGNCFCYCFRKGSTAVQPKSLLGPIENGTPVWCGEAVIRNVRPPPAMHQPTRPLILSGTACASTADPACRCSWGFTDTWRVTYNPVLASTGAKLPGWRVR